MVMTKVQQMGARIRISFLTEMEKTLAKFRVQANNYSEDIAHRQCDMVSLPF